MTDRQKRYLRQLCRLVSKDDLAAAAGLIKEIEINDLSALLSWATQPNKEVMLRLLIENSEQYPILNADKVDAFYSMVESNSVEMVQWLIEKYQSLITQHEIETALSYAIERGYEGMTILLINKGARLNVFDMDDNQNTPLHKAVIYNQEAIVPILIDKGAEVDVRNKFSETPLLLAAQHGNEANTEKLMQQGATLNVSNCYKATLLHWIARNNLSPFLKQAIQAISPEVVQKGSKLDLVNHLGETPLIWAAQHGKTSMVKQLMQYGASLGATYLDPVLEAAKGGKAETVNVILIEAKRYANLKFFPIEKAPHALYAEATELQGMIFRRAEYDIVVGLLSVFMLKPKPIYGKIPPITTLPVEMQQLIFVYALKDQVLEKIQALTFYSQDASSYSRSTSHLISKYASPQNLKNALAKLYLLLIDKHFTISTESHQSNHDAIVPNSGIKSSLR